jgi:hypothetical protein
MSDAPITEYFAGRDVAHQRIDLFIKREWWIHAAPSPVD